MTPRRALAIAAPVALMAVIFALSSLPGRELPSPPFAQADKLVHLVAYALLGALTLRALVVGLGRGPRWWPAAAALAIAFGASDEWHQRFVPGRTCSAADLAADALGATLGALAPARRLRWARAAEERTSK